MKKTSSHHLTSIRLISFLIIFTILTTACEFPNLGQNKTACGQSTLKIGEHFYQIKTVKLKSNGSLNIPSNTPDTAFWIDGTNTNYVFGLSPTENNLALESSLKTGDTATITWDNCNSTTYSLSAAQSGVPDNSILFDQTASGITIFIQPDSMQAGFMIEGELAQETISVFNTPNPSEMQAEISLLETTTSDDGQTIRVNISILNYGQSAINLSTNDVALTPPDTAPLTMINSEPTLPVEIAPGATEEIHFTFPRPTSATTTLKIFSIEYELEGY